MKTSCKVSHRPRSGLLPASTPHKSSVVKIPVGVRNLDRKRPHVVDIIDLTSSSDDEEVVCTEPPLKHRALNIVSAFNKNVHVVTSSDDDDDDDEKEKLKISRVVQSAVPYRRRSDRVKSRLVAPSEHRLRKKMAHQRLKTAKISSRDYPTGRRRLFKNAIPSPDPPVSLKENSHSDSCQLTVVLEIPPENCEVSSDGMPSVKKECVEVSENEQMDTESSCSVISREPTLSISSSTKKIAAKQLSAEFPDSPDVSTAIVPYTNLSRSNSYDEIMRRNPVNETTSRELVVKTSTELVAALQEDMCSQSGFFAAKKKVKDMLRLFNSYYLRLVQEEETRCRKETSETIKRVKKIKNHERKKARRPDLKAITQMRLDKKMLEKTYTIGNIPGISVGDQFFSRCEMCAIGLHRHWLSGIDTIPTHQKNSSLNINLPVATSIVLSGAYEDDIDHSEDVIYTGQGGNDLLGNKRQIADQTLIRGNLALKNNMEQDIPVRLIRGHKTKKSYTGKLYTYDGLYKVVDYWAEKGISGFTVYKFRMKRLEGQPVLTTDQVHFVSGNRNMSELKGIVYKDISQGLEKFPIPVTNVFTPHLTPDFTYITETKVKEGVRKPQPAKGCNCEGQCVDPNKCSCAILNKRRFPYVMLNGGRLVQAMDVVYECGANCGCSENCCNRVTQKGMQYRLEVFRTANKGWGLRSWDTIPAGAPVCQYRGVLMKTEDADHNSDNEYIFDLDCLQTMKSLGVRQRRSVSNAEEEAYYSVVLKDVPEHPEYCIDAGTCGNVSRLINHSCEPNLFVQCVLNDHHDLSQPHIWFFAADTIPPLQELTYDYGYELNSVERDGQVKVLPCYCGAHGCRKRLY